jgi:hypothetical protein
LPSSSSQYFTPSAWNLWQEAQRKILVFFLLSLLLVDPLSALSSTFLSPSDSAGFTVSATASLDASAPSLIASAAFFFSRASAISFY